MKSRFFIIFLACFITSCGQSGGLYLPAQTSATTTSQHSVDADATDESH